MPPEKRVMEVENNTIEQLKKENEKLREKFSNSQVENAKIRQELYDLRGELSAAVDEKRKLLSIVTDLSRGFANLKG